ncbi:MAG: chitobiase/beta-hexosaminidase C-terminal domain-containing protein, partial [Sodaliphilus sp.]|nr:chitobiase/beta-hexosaminidase C-terminal domain-containing protein [Sodaliphilus sp.]
MNRIFTLIAMCVFTIGAAFAEETTIDFVSLYNSDKSVQPATPITSGAFSFSYEKGNSINAPAFFVSTSASNPVKEMRLYGGDKKGKFEGNTMTVTSTAAMKKIVFSEGSKFTYVEVKASEGTVEYDAKTYALTWTGDASTVTFTVLCNATTSSQWRFKKATITTGAAGETVVSKPTFSHEAGTYYSPFNLELKTGTTGAAIYYTLDGTDPTTASEKYVVPIAIKGNTTVKAIATLNGKMSEIATAEYVLGTAVEVNNIA